MHDFRSPLVFSRTQAASMLQWSRRPWQHPLGELKRSPRPPSHNKGPTSKGGRGRGESGKGKEGREEREMENGKKKWKKEEMGLPTEDTFRHLCKSQWLSKHKIETEHHTILSASRSWCIWSTLSARCRTFCRTYENDIIISWTSQHRHHANTFHFHFYIKFKQIK